MALLSSTTLTGCSSIPDFIATGTLMTFQQTTAPTSWTKQTTHNNKALRVVSGTASSGGTTAFTSVFASRTPTGSISVSGSNSGGTVGDTTLSSTQMPSHTHQAGSHYPVPGGGNIQLYLNGLITNVAPTIQTVDSNSAPTAAKIQSTGGSGAHAHPFSVPTWSGSASFTGNALDFAVQYVDIIIASKN